VNSKLKMALAATAVVVVAGAAIACGPAALAPSSAVAQSPVPSSSEQVPSATTSPSPSIGPLSTTGWMTYHSKLYGFDIGHPIDLPFDGAPDHVWTLAKDSPSFKSTALENFHRKDAVNGDVRVSAWSVAVEPGTTLEEWIAAYCQQNDGPCTGIQDRAVAVYAGRDRHPGLLAPFTDDAYAFFLDNDRIYVVAVWRPEADPSVMMYGGSRRLLEALASTMSLGTPAPAATSPAPS
jgi:hypothetical protein